MKDDIIYTRSIDEFLETGCRIIIDQAKKKIQSKNFFSLVISGGRTPPLFFNKLLENFKNEIDWGKVDFFWLDERCVPPEHENSNYKHAYETLLSKLPATGRVYRIKGELNPSKAAESYEENLKNYFSEKGISTFDFILMGMGEDGHVASIFPDDHLVQSNKSNLVLATTKSFVGNYRVTLTYNIINASDYKLLMVNSKNKMEVLKNSSLKLPVHFVNNKTILIKQNILLDGD